MKKNIYIFCFLKALILIFFFIVWLLFIYFFLLSEKCKAEQKPFLRSRIDQPIPELSLM